MAPHCSHYNHGDTDGSRKLKAQAKATLSGCKYRKIPHHQKYKYGKKSKNEKFFKPLRGCLYRGDLTVTGAFAH